MIPIKETDILAILRERVKSETKVSKANGRNKNKLTMKLRRNRKPNP